MLYLSGSFRRTSAKVRGFSTLMQPELKVLFEREKRERLGVS